MHENRETSEMPEANLCDRPAGEGSSRTARVHVFELQGLLVLGALVAVGVEANQHGAVRRGDRELASG